MAGGETARGAAPLAGRRVLLVEDEFFLAQELARAFAAQGAAVIGPAATTDDALDLIEQEGRIDGAVLDLNLQGEMAYTVADALLARGVPFVFATGYDAASIPARYAGVSRCEKPVSPAAITRALFG